MTKIKFTLITAMLILTGILAWKLYFFSPMTDLAVNIHEFPKTIGDWDSEELIITEDEYKILETRNAFIRKYTNDQTEESVYLFIVYSQNNRKVSHPPEICYTGGGATILDNTRETIELNGETVAANNLTLALGDTRQLSYYWFKVGEDTYTSNYWKQQMLIALNTIMGRSASTALIRVSSDIGKDGKEATNRRIKTFIRTVAPLFPQYLP